VCVALLQASSADAAATVTKALSELPLRLTPPVGAGPRVLSNTRRAIRAIHSTLAWGCGISPGWTRFIRAVSIYHVCGREKTNACFPFDLYVSGTILNHGSGRG
jgi:hypothetical protein